MTHRAMNPQGNKLPDASGSRLSCPVCSGRMETVYSRGHQEVLVCEDCHADLTVPSTAWAVLRSKRGETRNA